MLLYVGLVLLLTLRPGPGAQETIEGLCILCGERGSADALLNFLLFLPLGLLARLTLRSTAAAILLSLALAGGIEAVQLLLPGRDPSLGDILFNAAGGGAGATASVVGRALGKRRGVSPRLPLLAATVVVGIHAVTAWSLDLQLPRGRYFSFWGPELGHLSPTDARLTQVTLGGRPVPEGWVDESDTVRRFLTDGRPLAVTLEPGPAPTDLGGLYALYDDRQREILLVGRIRDELVLRLHRRSAHLRLDAPDIRVPEFFSEGGDNDPMTIRIERDGAGGGYCVARSRGSAPVGERQLPETRPPAVCALGLTLGRGWALLAYPDALAEALRTLLDIAWIGLLFLPIGLSASARRETSLGVAMAVGSLVAVPIASGLLPTPGHLYAAAAAGLCAGLALVRRRSRPGRSAA